MSFFLDKPILSLMDKDEHSHLHGYQDQKDEFNEKLDALATRLYKDMWSNSKSISGAISETLAESMDYAAIIKYCHKNNSTTLLGAVTLELIDLYLSELADELAESEII